MDRRLGRGGQFRFDEPLAESRGFVRGENLRGRGVRQVAEDFRDRRPAVEQGEERILSRPNSVKGRVEQILNQDEVLAVKAFMKNFVEQQEGDRRIFCQ